MRWLPRLIAVGVLAGTVVPGVRADEPRNDPGPPVLRFQADPTARDYGSVVLTGLSERGLSALAGLELEQWRQLFPVRVRAPAEQAEPLPAMLGRYALEGHTVRFHPRFPPRAGVAYEALFHGRLVGTLVPGVPLSLPSLRAQFLAADSRKTARTRVQAVYPSARKVPENLLRLYVYFSAPMRARDVERHVRLLDAGGHEVPEAFVEVRHGLWDPSHRRLTLFFHPGRIKREVGPHQVLGPPLLAGRRYRLVVDRQLRDARGAPLAEGFEKWFYVVAADRAVPVPTHWTLTPPVDATAPLVVDFPEALDHALLQRLLAIEDGAGRTVAGEVEIYPGERRWSFRPARPWVSEEYSLLVHPGLEDLAGNRVDGLFETEGAGPLAERRAKVRTPVVLTFRAAGVGGADR